MALEDGDWERADDFFEKVLNRDAENAEAYLGKALAQLKCKNIEGLIRLRLDKTQSTEWTQVAIKPDTEHIQQAQKKYKVPGFLNETKVAELYAYKLTYTTCVPARKRQRKEEEEYWKNHKQLSRAMRFSTGSFANKLKSAYQSLLKKMDARIIEAEEEQSKQHNILKEKYIVHLNQTDEYVIKLYSKALQDRENCYQENLRIAQNSNSAGELAEANKALHIMGDYKDSIALAEFCIEKKEKILVAEKAAEEKHIAAEKKKKIIKRILFALILCIIITIELCVVIGSIIRVSSR